MLLALILFASLLEVRIMSMIEIGQTFPVVCRELNSPSVVKPISEGMKIPKLLPIHLTIYNIVCKFLKGTDWVYMCDRHIFACIWTLRGGGAKCN